MKSLFYSKKRKAFFYLSLVSTILLSISLFGQTKETTSKKQSLNTEDNDLINKYIETKGKNIIVFDSSIIKRFWVDKSVLNDNNLIKIILGEPQNSSVPLPIQLANVSETQDCRIDVISESSDLNYSVINASNKVLSTSSQEDSFLQYKIISSTIHLDDTSDYSFYLKFNSKSSDVLSIKNIVLSFPNNIYFRVSPGVLKITGNEVTGDNISREGIKTNDLDNSFSASGKVFTVFSKAKILVGDNTLSSSVKVKNVGDVPATVYFGYRPCTVDKRGINKRITPYKNINHVLKVISSEENSNTIKVDSYPEWEKGCFLVLNAEEDLSDFPNYSFVDGSIVEIKKLSDEQSEIIFDKPIKDKIKPGTKVRVHSRLGNTYIYTNIKHLAPGEEATLTSTIKKDDNFFGYDSSSFCRGTHYVIPLIVSTSDDPNTVNTILVKDFSVSY